MPNVTRDYRISRGLCPACGVDKPEAGHDYCPRCREINRRRMAAQRETRKAEWLCTVCGKKLPTGSEYVACRECRAKCRASQKKARVKNDV